MRKPKPPKYNPLSMSNKKIADKYGADMLRYRKKLAEFKNINK